MDGLADSGPVTFNPDKGMDGTIAFITGSGKVAVTFHPDGRVEVGPDFTPDEAAKVFWEAVIAMNPYHQQMLKGGD